VTDIVLGYPSDADWPWITAQYVETVWASLTVERQKATSRQIVQDCIVRQINGFRATHGTDNQVFLARDTNGGLAGFIWVGQSRSGFTGVVQAYILSVHVAEACRGQGLGRRLMARAEAWAREHGFTSIGLSVAAHNIGATKLYVQLGYQTETLRMSRDLDAPPPARGPGAARDGSEG
jgi:ribosomal protein S18 acetylase RimI-like enzyme